MACCPDLALRFTRAAAVLPNIANFAAVVQDHPPNPAGFAPCDLTLCTLGHLSRHVRRGDGRRQVTAHPHGQHGYCQEGINDSLDRMDRILMGVAVLSV
jgi:hypothetical protein